MTEYDGYALTYDQSGNPITWYSTGKQWQLDWTSGELTSATADDMTISYGYDMHGVRDEKTVNGIKHEYVTQGGNVVYETWGNNKLEFIYGSSGEPYSVIYNGTTYYYVTNLQGDVVRLVNSSGTTVAAYTYNGWGEVLEVESNSSDNIANINSIRYRGYYYDNETGWYYLKNRYYDSTAKRMISADTEESITENLSIVGQRNLFLYCNNNPIVNEDADGNYCHIAVAAVIGGVVSMGATIAANCYNCNGDPWHKGLITSLIAGAASGALGATTLGFGALTAANAGISMLQSSIDQLTENRMISIKEVAVNGAIGAVTGAGKGSGSKHLNAMGKQFMKKSIRIVKNNRLKKGGSSILKAGKYYYKNTVNSFYKPFKRGVGKSIPSTVAVSLATTERGRKALGTTWSRAKRAVGYGISWVKRRFNWGRRLFK